MHRLVVLAVIGIVTTTPWTAAGQERLCDTQFEDCRTPLLELIRNERLGIDVAFWFMEDARYATELINRHRAGVPVRVLMDQRANASKRHNETILNILRDNGIPMREKYTRDILHFKMMLFHGQNVVQFSKANYSSGSLSPIVANVNFFDEAIYFANDTRLTNSVRRRFDDLWTNTSAYRNFANVTSPLARRYPTHPIDPSMNFPPLQDFAVRSVSRYDRETAGIDAIVFRVTDGRHTDAMIRAVKRGVPVRLITEPTEYRNPMRLWHAKHVDRMYAAGVQITQRRHEGLTHQASVVMHALGEVVFGSSNWTTASAASQDEHNYFYDPRHGKPWFFAWFADQFARKWNDTNNFAPFQPLPPAMPVYSQPLDGAAGASSTVTLTWEGGTWAHLYDIYFGTDPNPPLVATDLELGSPEDGRLEQYTLRNLQPGTTYYWRIVGKTWAGMGTTGPTWSFTTAGVREEPFALPAVEGVPLAMDFDGDRRADLGLWEEATGTWFVRRSRSGDIATRQWGTASAPYGDVPVPGDYDGDGRADVAVWRRGDGTWFVIRSSDGTAMQRQWGTAHAPYGDVPVPGDYDGDGRTDFAVWRTSTGVWYVIRSSDGRVMSRQWGTAHAPYEDVPLPGDYDGDGKTDFAVWRRGTGTWFIIRSSDGAAMERQWGTPAAPYYDLPVPADYDGDSKTDVAVWRSSTGVWYVIRSSDGRVMSQQWGTAHAPYGDAPVPADYDGDGKADIAVWRRSTGSWYVIQSSNGAILSR